MTASRSTRENAQHAPRRGRYTFMDQEPTVADETQPTERFIEQPCPSCGARNLVALCRAEESCTRCGGVFEVAPLGRR